MKLKKSDFDCIGLVAKHCNWDKLCIAIDEAFEFDMKPLLCEMGYDVSENWDLSCEVEPEPEEEDAPIIDEEWQTILCGGEVTGCGGKKMTISGLKKVLVYFAYARYIIINNWDDTPNGAVTKTNDWSIPKDVSLLRAMSNKYDTMARTLWSENEAYLCSLGWNLKNCKGCGCNGTCGTYNNTKGFGRNSGNIGKYDL